MIIKRESYLGQLRRLKNRNLIKVVTGIRRSGKSTLLELFRDELLADGVASRQIQFLNFEERKNLHLTNWVALHDEIEAKLVPDAMNYVFLDEIQLVDDFERMVDSLFVKKNTDVYITGSNAFLLSGELATRLSGRYVSLNVLPLSFAEYTEIFPKLGKNELFGQYLNASSFPEAAVLSADAPEMTGIYLRDLYDTVVKKDIFSRYDIRDEAAFEKVLKFALDSVGSFISGRNIAAQLAGGRKAKAISNHTVDTYLRYLTGSYLLYKVDRYDIKGKNLLKTQDKYYAVDLGLRTALVGGKAMADLGHKLENLVYLELRRRNIGDIWVGKQDNLEVDFVVQNPAGEREYYQVAYTAHDQGTLRRELAPFYKIRDNYPKFLLTTDLDHGVMDGIRKINVVEWLLGTAQK